MAKRPPKFRRGPFDLWGFLRKRLWDYSISAGATAVVSGCTSTSVIGTEIATGGALKSVTGQSSTSTEGIETVTGGATRSVLGQASSGALASVAVHGGAVKAVTGQTSTSTEGIDSVIGAARATVSGLPSSTALASVLAFGAAVATVSGQESVEALGFGPAGIAPAPAQGGGGGSTRSQRTPQSRKPTITRKGNARVRALPVSVSELGHVTAHGVVYAPPAESIWPMAPQAIKPPFEPAIAGHINAGSGSSWTEEVELIALLMFEEAA